MASDNCFKCKLETDLDKLYYCLCDTKICENCVSKLSKKEGYWTCPKCNSELKKSESKLIRSP